MVPVDRRRHRLDELLAAGPLLAVAGGRVGELDPGLGGELLDRAHEVDVLDLLDEREHVAGRVAAEALVAAGLLAHVERRRLLGVERTQPDPVAARLARVARVATRRRRSKPSSGSARCRRQRSPCRPRLTVGRARYRSSYGGPGSAVAAVGVHLGGRRGTVGFDVARRSGGDREPLRLQREADRRGQHDHDHDSESHVGMWYHSWISIFTPTKARMIASPCWRYGTGRAGRRAGSTSPATRGSRTRSTRTR